MKNTSSNILDIKVSARENGVTSKSGTARYVADVVHSETIEGDELYQQLAEFSHMGSAGSMKSVIDMVDAFILEKLAEGKRVKFPLVSFRLHLTGSLSSKDADPVADGLRLKAMATGSRALGSALDGRLRPVNAIGKVFAKIDSVYNESRREFGVIGIGDRISVAGKDVKINPAREDEGVWLEDMRHRHVVARATIEKSDHIFAVCTFNGEIPPGDYYVVLGTRDARGDEYDLARALHKVKVVA